MAQKGEDGRVTMPRVKLKIYFLLLGQDSGSPSPTFEEISVSVPEDESVLEMARRLTAENRTFGTAIFDEQTQRIRSDVLVIHNGQFVKDPLETSLKENDEVMLLPLMEGG